MTEPLAAFRLVPIHDPEERLEDAALWKAMHDEYGDCIVPIGPEDDACGLPVFGRGARFRGHGETNPVSSLLPYWRDPAFLRHARRDFSVVPFERLEDEVARLHALGMDAFVKSTRQKQAIFRIPAGADAFEIIGDMAYSFIDGGPELIVQQSVRMEFEHRFFCIGREIVTYSPIQWSLTPLDFPLPPGTAYRTPSSRLSETLPDGLFDRIRDVAANIASSMETPHAVIDCALIEDVPGAVELNPMQVGQTGLYACDVRALAAATRRLLPEPAPALSR